MHSEGNHKQNEKTTHRMGENICKWNDWLGINFQNSSCSSMSEKQTTQSKNDLNRHFSKEDVCMAKRHKKRCSSVLIKRLQTMNSGEAIEKREPFYTVSENVNH